MAMVETQSSTVSSKRPRDEAQETQMLEDPNKRQKSYNHILSLLDEDEEEPTQDLNSLITTLQQELSSDALTNPDQLCITSDASDASEGYNSSSSDSSSPSSSSALFLKEEEESSVERVMRHLLEASDDELGIPHMEAGNVFEDAEEVFSFGDNGLSLCDGLWELEDEAANYYALVQSELFM
ncbi:PREDICTED: uncharacterized protein LOC101308457 [Fragaria vesca subsp. vesca]|uniref:uncharacterized protein LOC101308457 n=1 Tax=Fragaria vesca subsp. vesca TaxID=101020 RepID=UPI0002C3461B|nr:PREDICTED: uncharacterized protein LOC101308457 [Fragaria vesca subsp. vesca]